MKNEIFFRFCAQAPKDEKGYVLDILDMEDKDKDAACAAHFMDYNVRFWNGLACEIMNQYVSQERKNSIYQSVEWIIRDLIDQYNNQLDDDIFSEQKRIEAEEFNMQEFSFYSDHQKMLDAGHKYSDF